MTAYLADTRALVTGGASGIGAAIATHLAHRGADVLIWDRDGHAAAQTADRIGGQAQEIDLADTHLLENILDIAPPAVDILVNCAGIQHTSPLADFDPARFRTMQKVMVEAPFLLIRAVLPHMTARHWGRIINISSVHGLRASADKAAYITAKHALEGLSKATALEGAGHGVTSNTICPGWVRTPLAEAQTGDGRFDTVPIKEWIEPSEVASLVGFLCTAAAKHITGTSHSIDGGWSAR